MKRILIEWLHYGNDGSSPLSEAPDLIRGAIETVRPFLRTMQTQLDFRVVELTEDCMDLSGTVRINGREMEGSCAALSGETLVDAILQETTRFIGTGCGCSPEDLCR